MFSVKRKSQSGFSLVELMVVVAIIGVLASIAVPAVNKYLAKARQSEAKTNLASLYTAEKAFYAEWTAYDSRFGAVNFSPEGQLRYNVGFSSAVAAPVGSGYTFPAGASALFSTLTYCAVAGSGCTTLQGAKNSMPTAISGTAVVANTAASGSTFIAEARAAIHSGAPAGAGGEDVWRMTELKIMTNVQNGIR